MPSFSIRNFGCRVNQAEAFSWAEELEHAGMSREDDPVRADWVIVNTCTLTARADRDVRKFIRRLSRLNPAASLVLTGCSVDGGSLRPEDLTSRALLLPNSAKAELAPRILSGLKAAAVSAAKPLRSRALLKVQDGCDLSCTFCIIPSVRGRSRSTPRAEILAQARRLIDRGFREIVLCGIHLSSYGLDLHERRIGPLAHCGEPFVEGSKGEPPPWSQGGVLCPAREGEAESEASVGRGLPLRVEPQDSLSGLLRSLLELEGLGMIRLSSLDPRNLDKEFIDLITGDPRVCPHFHLSLQHASDRILKLMGRGSASSDYERILGRLRERSPDAALGADVIVGFPGEEENDFERLLDFTRGSPLDYLHVFSYSPRPGTRAAEWARADESEKRRRSAVLRKLSEEKRRSFRVRFIGRELRGIIVKKSARGAEVLTPNYINVRLATCSGQPGEEVGIKIVSAGSRLAIGEETARGEARTDGRD